MFGSRYDVNEEEFQRLIQFPSLMTRALNNAGLLSFMPWLRFFPNESVSLGKRAISLRDPILRKKVEEHKRTFDPDNTRDLTDALLSEMFKEEKCAGNATTVLDESRLEMILSDLVIGGEETTTTTLLWSFVYLAAWPEVQKKISEEMKQVLDGRKPCLNDRGTLHFLEATINEASRLASIVPLGLPHKTTRDTVVGGWSIPQNTQVLFNHWAFHHDERHWKNPDTFIPERWLDEEGRLIPGAKLSYLPFGAGRRVCLGESLAKMELFLILSNILYRYEIQKAPNCNPADIEGRMNIIHSPIPFQVVVNKRPLL